MEIKDQDISIPLARILIFNIPKNVVKPIISQCFNDLLQGDIFSNKGLPFGVGVRSHKYLKQVDV